MTPKQHHSTQRHEKRKTQTQKGETCTMVKPIECTRRTTHSRPNLDQKQHPISLNNLTAKTHTVLLDESSKE